MKRVATSIAVGTVWLGSAGAALAHPGHSHAGGGDHGFMSGLLHPLLGLDHLLAMVAVGLLAARVGGKAMWRLPATFLGAMCCGGVAARLGLELPMVEYGIGASVLVLGVLVAIGSPMPLRIGVPMIALFAWLHGAAHAGEMAASASTVVYFAGFLLATLALHLGGAGGGLALARLEWRKAFQYLGAGIAAASVAILAGWI